MPIGLRNLEWISHNQARRYPVVQEATLRDQSGNFEVPNDFLVACYLAVHAGHSIDPGKFFLQLVGAFSGGYSLTIGYDAGGTTKLVATALISRSSHVPFSSYRLGGVGDFPDATGTIMIGRLDSIDLQPGGQFTFDPAASRLETDCVRPMLRGVTAIQVENGVDVSSRLIGDVVLRAGRNIRLTVDLDEQNRSVVIIDAIEGEGLNEPCLCEGEASAQPITSINGIPPDDAGNFVMLGNECLEWEPIAHGLRANDTCSSPCCGCTELETLTQALELFGQQATTLEHFISTLEARSSQLENSILAAKLNDRGCRTC